MNNIEKIVLDSAKIIVSEKNPDVDVDIDFIMSQHMGFDSLGFVSFALELEDSLSIEIDTILPEMRACNKLRDVVNLLTNLY